MKKLFLILIVAFAFVSFFSCGDDMSAEDVVEQNVVEQNVEICADNMPEIFFSGNPFQISDSRFFCKILVDEETRVQYALVYSGRESYGVPLIDSIGNPSEDVPEFAFLSGSFQIPDSYFFGKILVNKKTGVQYVLVNRGYVCCGFALVDSFGKPILYDGN